MPCGTQADSRGRSGRTYDQDHRRLGLLGLRRLLDVQVLHAPARLLRHIAKKLSGLRV